VDYSEAEIAMEVAGKKLSIKHIPGPLGVRGRNSDNHLIKRKLGWTPSQLLRVGMERTEGQQEGGKMGRWEDWKIGRWEGGKIGRWEDGKFGNYDDGKLGIEGLMIVGL
jgi:hypothetical protein